MCPGHPADERCGHDNTDHDPHVHLPHRRRRKPSRLRRTAVGVTAFLACALPAVFTVNITRMLLTGIEPDHRFHQATGQGLILFALWLGALLPLVRAGWSGADPSTATGSCTSRSLAPASLCAALAPGGGAPFLVGVIVVTGALLWLAMPLRPRLRVRRSASTRSWLRSRWRWPPS